MKVFDLLFLVLIILRSFQAVKHNLKYNSNTIKPIDNRYKSSAKTPNNDLPINYFSELIQRYLTESKMIKINSDESSFDRFNTPDSIEATGFNYLFNYFSN